MSNALKYRPDIDGLRAIAILAVLFYHVGLSFPGGFVGVDVFFVISGYLITSIIWPKITSQTFSLSDFFEKRVRRLFPAACVMMVGILLVGYFIAIPSEYRTQGGVGAAQSLIGGNFYLWRNLGYFDTTSQNVNLLHMWSLAVEEQFYIIFPIILLLSFRFFKGRILWFILTGLVASFTLCIWGAANKPVAAFYLLPTRAWEMLLGALAASSLCGTFTTDEKKNETLSLLGLLLIGSTFFLFNHATTYPSWRAIIPCIGTVLFLKANENVVTTSGRLIAKPVFVFIGAISYSLYLWHWPIYIYFRDYAYNQELPIVGKLLVCVTSLALAYLSYRCIENPIRKRSALKSRKSLYLATSIASVILCASSFAIFKSGGLPNRFNEEFSDTFTNLKPAKTYKKTPFRKLTVNDLELLGDTSVKPSLLVWGDSHSGMYQHAIDELALENNIACYVVSMPSVPPLLNCWNTLNSEKCVTYNQSVLDLCKQLEIKDVLIISHWSLYLLPDPEGRAKFHIKNGTKNTTEDILQSSVSSTLKDLSNAMISIHVLKSIPILNHDLEKTLMIEKITGRSHDYIKFSRAEHLKKHQTVNTLLDEFDVNVYDPSLHLFDEKEQLITLYKNKPTYFDSNHLSLYGVELCMPTLNKVFNKL